ncbi:hypothetical protein C8R44DRAFT_628960 [Mycena epipterygia]|nr:hypothetical protein C8R44DRAFT_628960 [Mycena epipterygia]
MKKHELQQLVKAGTPMFYSAPHNTWSMLDLVFTSKGVLADSLVKCWATPGDGSDHNALHIIFNVTVVHHNAPLRRNFRAADWKEYPVCLEWHIAANPLPALPLADATAINMYTNALTKNMVSAIKELVPLSCPSPHTHRWWSRAIL